MRIHDQLPTTKASRTGSDESGPKLHQHMQQIKEIGNSTEKGNINPKLCVIDDAGGTADGREVEVERVEEKGNERGNKKYVVPVSDDIAVGLENLVAPKNVVGAEVGCNRHGGRS